MTTYANVGHILLKRGNTVQSNAYTGKLGELTINTDTNEVAVHDGATVGGVATLASTASATAINVAISNLTNSVSTITGIDATFVANINALLANAASQDTAINNITNGSVTFGNIIPSANVTYSLGTADAQWKDLWVSNNTIYIGNTPITVHSDGTLLVNGNAVTGGGATYDQSLNTTDSVIFDQLNTPLVNFGQYTLGSPANGGIYDKVRLYNFENPDQTNYALGVEPNFMWFSTDAHDASTGFKFYGTNNTELLRVTGDGGTTVPGILTIGNGGQESHLRIDASNYWSSIQWVNMPFMQDPNATPFECQAQLMRVFRGSGDVEGHEELVAVSVVQPTGTTLNGLMITTSDGKIPDAPYNDGMGTQHNFVFEGDGNLILPVVDMQASPAVQSTGIVFGDGTFQSTAYTTQSQATNINSIDGYINFSASAVGHNPGAGTITFADGTQQTTAFTGAEGTKTWTNPNNNVWRIEEYNGGSAIQYIRTATTTYSTTSTITQADPDFITIDFNSDSYVETILNNSTVTAVEINGTTYQITGGYSYGGGTVSFPAAGVTYDPGTTATLTFIDWQAPLQPVLWYDPANSRSGDNNFRGAIVEYHAYCSSGGTVVGKVMISRDWQAAASHEESTAGSDTLSFYEFWNLGDNNGSQPGKLYLFINDPGNPNRTDNQVWIQWTSKIFYGSEAWC